VGAVVGRHSSKLHGFQPPVPRPLVRKGVDLRILGQNSGELAIKPEISGQYGPFCLFGLI